MSEGGSDGRRHGVVGNRDIIVVCFCGFQRVECLVRVVSKVDRTLRPVSRRVEPLLVRCLSLVCSLLAPVACLQGGSGQDLLDEWMLSAFLGLNQFLLLGTARGAL